MIVACRIHYVEALDRIESKYSTRHGHESCWMFGLHCDLAVLGGGLETTNC